MENPAKGGAPACLSGGIDSADHSPCKTDTQRACRAIEAGLICLPDAADAAFVLRHRLNRPQRLWGAAAFTMSLDSEGALQMAEATRQDALAAMKIPADRIGATPEIEAERQRRAWAAHCADPARRLRRGRS